MAESQLAVGGPHLQSYVTFWLRGHVKNSKNLYLHFCNTYGHQTWQQFVIFKPLSYYFKKTIGFDVRASFAGRPLSHLIRWCNKRILRNSWIENYKLAGVLTSVGKPHISSQMTFWSSDHMTDVKSYIWPSAVSMATKLGRVVTCGGETPPSKSRDLLIMGSRDEFKNLIFALQQYLWPSNLAGL